MIKFGRMDGASALGTVGIGNWVLIPYITLWHQGLKSHEFDLGRSAATLAVNRHE